MKEQNQSKNFAEEDENHPCTEVLQTSEDFFPGHHQNIEKVDTHSYLDPKTNINPQQIEAKISEKSKEHSKSKNFSCLSAHMVHLAIIGTIVGVMFIGIKLFNGKK